MPSVKQRPRANDIWTEFDEDLLVEMASRPEETMQRPSAANQNDSDSFLFLNGACG